MESPKPLSIVIAYHEGESYLKACLRSILPTIRECDEIIVVVNNSNALIHDLHLFEDRVIYKHYFDNLGYASAINKGVEAAKNEFVIISDHDLVYQLGFIEELWTFYKSQTSLGAVSCKIINTATNNVLDYGIGFSGFNFAHPFMDLPLVHELTNFNRICQMVCAGGLLMEKRLFQNIGGFDESFGSLYTDLDICLRLKKVQLNVGVACRASAYHFAGEFAQGNKSYKASFLKSDVKGAFMKKNAGVIEIDMARYYKMSANYFLERHGAFKNYLFCNMMNVANPSWYEETIQALNIVPHDRIKRPSGFRDAENTRLFETLGFDIMVLGIPIAYFVDRYISLKENSFWWNQRRNPSSDIIIDRNGNIVSFIDMH